MPRKDGSRRKNLKTALRHALEEGMIVVGLALIALGVKSILQIAGIPPEIIHPVETTHKWLIIFASAYIPARFWAGMVVDDLEAGIYRMRRFSRGFLKFVRREYLKWKEMRGEVENTQDKQESSSQEEGVGSDD